MGLGTTNLVGGGAIAPPTFVPPIIGAPMPVQPVLQPTAAPAAMPFVTAGGSTQAPLDDAQAAIVIQQLTAAVEAVTKLVQLAAQQRAAGLPMQPMVFGGGPTMSQPAVQLPTAPPLDQVDQRAAKAAQSGVEDGPGVARKIIAKDKLEQDPKLRGKLDPPTGGKPPKGVKVRTKADGTRMLTINIHGGAPAGKSTSQGRDIRAVRDVARYINAVDPDVITVQEINDSKGSNVPHLTSVLAHLIKADDMAFHPGNGMGKDPKGTATYTRNGYTIDHAVNVDLPDKGDPARRSAGIVQVLPPQGEAFTVVSTHLSHMPGTAASTRRRNQMQEIARVVDSIRDNGAFTYRAPGGAGQQRATGFASDRILLGGDLNTTMNGREAGIDPANRLLGAAGLRNVYALNGERGSRPGIDHIYAHGFQASGNVKFDLAAHELPGGRPTDHPGYVVDLT